MCRCSYVYVDICLSMCQILTYHPPTAATPNYNCMSRHPPCMHPPTQLPTVTATSHSHHTLTGVSGVASEPTMNVCATTAINPSMCTPRSGTKQVGKGGSECLRRDGDGDGDDGPNQTKPNQTKQHPHMRPPTHSGPSHHTHTLAFPRLRLRT